MPPTTSSRFSRVLHSKSPSASHLCLVSRHPGAQSNYLHLGFTLMIHWSLSAKNAFLLSLFSLLQTISSYWNSFIIWLKTHWMLTELLLFYVSVSGTSTCNSEHHSCSHYWAPKFFDLAVLRAQLTAQRSTEWNVVCLDRIITDTHSDYNTLCYSCDLYQISVHFIFFLFESQQLLVNSSILMLSKI